MYESFYGLSERPFALTPDPSFLFLSPKHALALSMLEYSVTGQAGFTVVTGEIGSGKTTLIRQFLRRVSPACNLGVISNTHEAFGDLLQWVLYAFAQDVAAPDKAGRYQQFVQYLIAQYGLGKQTVLIVDEAQNLSIETLEELRLLSNVNADKDQLIQMILVGQPELLEKLRRPELKQFAQRISVHYHLQALSYPETRDYIRHRLRTAGAKRAIFDRLAIGAIYYFSGGVPRLINSICDMALVYGFAQGEHNIDIDTILSVVKDREGGTLLALPNSTAHLDRDQLTGKILQELHTEDSRPDDFLPDDTDEPSKEAPQPGHGALGTGAGGNAIRPSERHRPVPAEDNEFAPIPRAPIRHHAREAAKMPPIMPIRLSDDDRFTAGWSDSLEPPKRKRRWLRWFL